MRRRSARNRGCAQGDRARYPVKPRRSSSAFRMDLTLRRYLLNPKSLEAGVLNSEAQKIVLTYIGSVYGSTDPRTFVEAVPGTAIRSAFGCRVRFIGHIETQAYREAC